ncbi:hypothetical protein ebA2773 [Aromatoleum aromaticum EbN1]|uniref:Uncharacterized protein n=1 Tax=Aromatoleum aromaticum (strain DSM 19018 / LMG 30748 / EbN1) TaxID=76114 RepID=Q5P4S8_AROAE|nr:hypothetical protein ebA2773 [Aromatoleum aromaticum EbN1]
MTWAVWQGGGVRRGGLLGHGRAPDEATTGNEPCTFDAGAIEEVPDDDGPAVKSSGARRRRRI